MSVSLAGLSTNISTLFSAIGGSGSNATSASSLISIAQGNISAATSGASSENPIVALQVAQRNQTQDIKAESLQPAVQHQIAAFTKAVKSATSVKQLLANPTVLNVLLTANGLGSEAGFTALAQKALMSNPSDPKSLANQLSGTNSQWLSTAQTYQFATKGLAIIQQPSAISTITNGYAEVLWRQSLDAQTPGLSNALYLIQNAKNFTSAVQILGDSVMRSVVTTALGIPKQIAYQPLSAQEQAINNGLNVSDFQKPQFVQTFADRYLAVEQSAARSSASSSNNLAALAVKAQGLVA
ncbi:DUF1217 domain-containing protein [Acidiphilium sp. PA]|uniref:DUF1217 domain-containing protein n=1 Tax=Acidiphilium sp. PA TaxID=2871705 RepID=UPI0022441E5E|nr:DUF1217 domain-containing protein [Acidiphilium sp. PA]MCW8307648.1 DUF1217 domain-containing protein [Acidiphilium sp. PA]